MNVRKWVLACALLIGAESFAAAQTPPQEKEPTKQDAGEGSLSFNVNVTVVAITPLPGVELPATQVPSPVQTATARDIERSGALDIADFLNRRLTAVHVNEIQNNPFQADVNYRGYTASPLLGTPQGLSIYMDGVRLNQPFGEVVSWDLIPKIAIGSTTLMPGSNPLFGLNTLGGALALQTKDGRTQRGTTVQATYGSNIRRAVEVEHGGQTASQRFHWYFAGTLFGENGWRDDSPSEVRQLFGKIGWLRERWELSLSVAHANNSLTGNGLQDVQLLDQDYASIYTKPDVTDNASTLLTVSSRRRLTDQWSLLAQGYYRDIGTDTVNGDIDEDALTAPPGTVNGLLTSTETAQKNGGISAQLTHRVSGARNNVFIAGGGGDLSTVAFTQVGESGILGPNRGVLPLAATQRGAPISEPDDADVDLTGRVTTWSLFATDTLSLGARAHATVSARYNRTVVDNHDQLDPGGGPGSLDGRHTFARLNPSAGLTVDLAHGTNVYGGYSEGSRAATSIELGCADPANPCKLPNAMAGDPPLNQVVTRSFEGGARGNRGRLAWNAGVFKADNHDDILFVMSDESGFGYFRNFGQTQRQGVELGARAQVGRVSFGGGYTWLVATFESGETVNGESNSSNDAAEDGEPGLEGTITISEGDRLPLTPAHVVKLFAEFRLTSKLGLDVDLLANSGSIARGNENNGHEPDGVYYLGDGSIDGYAIVNLGGRYDLTSRVQLIGQINNLFNRQYSTAAQLGVAGFTADGAFAPRPFPPVGGEYPLRHSTFVAPGAPIRAWLGARLRF